MVRRRSLMLNLDAAILKIDSGPAPAGPGDGSLQGAVGKEFGFL
jgi:hypothetical protein